MSQITSGFSFGPTELLTDDKMNAIVGSAVLNPEAITLQTLITAASVSDKLMIFDASTGLLSSITLDNLMSTSFGPITTSQVVSFSGLSVGCTGILAINGGTSVSVKSINGTGTGGDLTLESDNTVVIGGSQATSDVSIISPLEVVQYADFKTTSAIKIPVGTTAQRPATPVVGQVRYNTTISRTEAYNGTSWESGGGGSPFEATGGNSIIAPDKTTTYNCNFVGTVYAAGFVYITVTNNNHGLKKGQVIDFTTTVTGYTGKWVVNLVIDANNFRCWIQPAALANSGTATYKKSGNKKIHTFTSNGSFVVGGYDGYVEVIVVGGGGAGYAQGGGGGGGFLYHPSLFITKNQTIYVTVGAGSNSSAAGGSSTFGLLIAYGGGPAQNPSVYGNTTLGGYGGSSSFAEAGGGGTIASTGLVGAYPAGGGGGGVIIASQSSVWNGAGGYGSTISGTYRNYGAGGAGYSLASNFGGSGQYPATTVSSGVFDLFQNTGAGGEGPVGYSYSTGANGVVIISYTYID